MNVEDVRAFCLGLKGTTEDMPYGDDMVVFRIEGKIYLHLPLEYAEPRISIKLDPEYAQQLRAQFVGVQPAYHLNKTHWSDVMIEGCFSDEQLMEWIQMSYKLVVAKLPKKVRVMYEL
ncbi:MAG: MmcQ/YjbR family DNA-binding protein [Paludibacteraceae bacterium]|nr:MmcQ/YjbR family DNA-binding protein [Paludibacteraceae bacterium]